MRQDSIGLFWEDLPPVKEKGQRSTKTRPLAPIPESNWKPPSSFPNLSSAKIIAIDTETFDPELTTCGPGWARGVGHTVGVSIAVEGGSWYFPYEHTLQPELNMDKEQVFKFLQDILGDNRPKVGANLQYDFGWLDHEGIKINGIGYDVQYAEALLDDVAKDYSLEAIAQKYLGTGKITNKLYNWIDRSYNPPARFRRREIYRSPTTLVGPYAEGDAHEPLEIFKKQWKELVNADLLELFKLECRLIPALIGMRKRGMPVDLEKAELVSEELQLLETEAQCQLDEHAGFHVGVYTNVDIQKMFDNDGISYPYTAPSSRHSNGQPSFTGDWLEHHTSTAAQKVNEVRKLNKARKTFIQNGIYDKQIDGKIYPSFHPLRGESGGAVSGRFSSSHPNAQQIPSRDKLLAPLIRGMYIPEPGYNGWLKLDLSQIEYRFFAHYSRDQQLIEGYQDPKTDYHDVVSGFLMGVMPRKIVKNFNFMSIFGGGKEKTISMIKGNIPHEQIVKLCNDLGLSTTGDTARTLGLYFVKLYAEKFPAARKSLQECAQIAENTGELRTILGRRNTFNLFVPKRKGDFYPLPYAQARARYGSNLQRYKTYKALNRRTQGSSADLLKKGFVEAYEAGVLSPDKLGMPHVTVHDEFDFSYHPDLRKYALEFKQYIENAIPLKVPVIMDSEVGTNWANVKNYDLYTGKMVE
jgi:DNA polymerase I-like protein with 3'-5' exonuclease and polymerase domains